MLSPYVCQQFFLQGLTQVFLPNLTGVYTITDETVNKRPVYRHDHGYQLAKLKSMVSSGAETREMQMWGITGVDIEDTMCVTDMFNFAPDKVEHVAQEISGFSWFCLSETIWIQDNPELTCMDPDCPLYLTMETFDLHLQDLNGYYAYSSVFEGAARYEKLDTEEDTSYDIVNIGGAWTLRNLESGEALLVTDGNSDGGGLCPPSNREWTRINSNIDSPANISTMLTNETRCPGSLGAQCSLFIMLLNLPEESGYDEYANLGGIFRYSESRWRNGFPIYEKAGSREYAFFKEGLWHFQNNSSESDIRCMCDGGFIYNSKANDEHPCFNKVIHYFQLRSFDSEEAVRELCPQFILVVDLPQDLYMLFGLYEIRWDASLAYPQYLARYGESGVLANNDGSQWMFSSSPPREHCAPHECNATRPSTGFFCPTREISVWMYYNTGFRKEFLHEITIEPHYSAPQCDNFIQVDGIHGGNPSALGAYEHRQRPFNGAVQYRQLDLDNEMGMTLFRSGLNLYLGVLQKDVVARRLNSSVWCPARDTDGWEVRCSENRDSGFCLGNVDMHGTQHPPLCPGKVYVLVSLPSDRKSPIVGVWKRENYRGLSNATAAYSSVFKNGASFYRRVVIDPKGLLEWEEDSDYRPSRIVSVTNYLYRSITTWLFQEDWHVHEMAYQNSAENHDICPANGTDSWYVEVSNNEGNLTAWIEEDVTFKFEPTLYIDICDSMPDETKCNSNKHCAWSIHQVCQTCMIHTSPLDCQTAQCMWVGNRNKCLGGSELTHSFASQVNDNQVSMSLEFIFVCTSAIMFSLISIFIAKKILTEHQDTQDVENQYRGASEKEINKLELKSFEIILEETKRKKRSLKKKYINEKRKKDALERIAKKRRTSMREERMSLQKPPESRGKRSSETRMSVRALMSSERRISRLSITSIDSSDVSISDVSEMECCICMTEFETSDNLRLLPCGHFFHVECIKKWLVTRSTCPFCRKDIAQS